MTIQTALKIASTDSCPLCSYTWSPDCKSGCKSKWESAREALLAKGLCPNCACCDGMRSRLGSHQPGSAHTYAGRECPNCEEFYPSEYQAEYCTAELLYSDADPGL